MKKMYLFSYSECLHKLKTCCEYVACISPVNLHVCIYVHIVCVHEFSLNL